MRLPIRRLGPSLYGMRSLRFIFLCLLILPSFALRAEENVTYPTAPLAIKAHGKVLHFTVEVATSEDQQRHGLMFRNSLPAMHGMIFVFAANKQVTFWMKDTPLPLDMLFIDRHGIISQIVEKATPESTTPIPSMGKVRAVLELIGGAAAQYHIARGDKVIYRLAP